MKKSVLISLASILLLSLSSFEAKAQFADKREAFTQSYNDRPDSLAQADTSDQLINFQEIFGGLAHKRSMRIGTMFGTSVILPGASQIYHKQYWKLPIIYGGMGAGIAGGIMYNNRYKQSGLQQDKTISTLSFVGAGLFYYASLMDGAICYKADRVPYPGRSTIYSILCPGLGQAYNGEYWKIPIYVGGLIGSVHFLDLYGTQFKRFRDIYRETQEPGYTGPITADQAKYYRDIYRKYRDYSWVAIGLFYLIQVIDANVFAYMTDFEVTEKVTASVGPTMILPDNNVYAMRPTTPAAGFSFGIRF